eukprot:scaffold1_cov108-Cylindrotheca_fusiformis.AAC.8
MPPSSMYYPQSPVTAAPAEDDDLSYSTASQSVPPSQLSVFRDESVGSAFQESDKTLTRERSYKKVLTSKINLPRIKSSNNVMNAFCTTGGGGQIHSPPSRHPFKAFALHASPGSRSKIKADIARTQRMIDRLDQAEMQLKMTGGSGSFGVGGCDDQQSNDVDHRRIRQRAELQLRLSQIEVARNFYERRMTQNAASTGPVPIDILNTVKSVSTPKLFRPRPVEFA